MHKYRKKTNKHIQINIYKHTYTDTQIQIHKCTNTQIQIHKYKYTYKNTQIKIRKYNLCNLDAGFRPTLGGEVGQLGGEKRGGDAGQRGLHDVDVDVDVDLS